MEKSIYKKLLIVSIPQAVSTVATKLVDDPNGFGFIDRFNTASGKYCCNGRVIALANALGWSKFQYRKR